LISLAKKWKKTKKTKFCWNFNIS